MSDEIPEIPCKDGWWGSGEWTTSGLYPELRVYTSGEGGSTGSSDTLCANPGMGVPQHRGGDPAKVGTPDDFCWDNYGFFGNAEGRYNPGDKYRIG